MTIEITNVSVRFGENVVVNNVGVDVERGGWLGLVGPNGAGKSTLLRAVCGLVPFTGTISFGEAGLASHRSRAVAYVPQRPLLPLAMSVEDYVLLGRTPYISLFAMESQEDREVAWSVMDRLELDAFAARRLGELSGGEAQRAVLARALAQQAPVLVLDEPKASLDLGHALQVLELTDELRRELQLSVICAMHDLTSAGQFADQLLLLVKGQTVAMGTPCQVFDESTLESAFGTPVQVIADSDGGLVVTTTRARVPGLLGRSGSHR